MRRICQYILCFKASIEAELSSSTREKKEYCKVQSIFVQEDGTLDSEASIFLGLLMKNKISKFDLEMICGVHFQGKGDNREIGVSLATAITEASVQKFIQVLRKQHGKLNAEPVVHTTTTDTSNEIVTCIPNIVPNLASELPSC